LRQQEARSASQLLLLLLLGGMVDRTQQVFMSTPFALLLSCGWSWAAGGVLLLWSLMAGISILQLLLPLRVLHGVLGGQLSQALHDVSAALPPVDDNRWLVR
jgi:hypothetical protein